MLAPISAAVPERKNVYHPPLEDSFVRSLCCHPPCRLFVVDGLITGADFAGRNVFGQFDLSGHAFNPALYGLGAFEYWDFTAPPYDASNFTSPVTGPINLTIHVAYDDGHVPEPSSLLLLVCALPDWQGGDFEKSPQEFRLIASVP